MAARGTARRRSARRTIDPRCHHRIRVAVVRRAMARLAGRANSQTEAASLVTRLSVTAVGHLGGNVGGRPSRRHPEFRLGAPSEKRP